MFSYCNCLISFDISNFNIDNIKEFNFLFYGCHNLSKIDLSLSIIHNKNMAKKKKIFYDCLNVADIYLK